MRRRCDYRQMPYRLPREVRGQRGAFALILRFARHYVWPHRWPVLLCVALMSFSTCAVYLQSYYSRIAVDEVLMVGAAKVTHVRQADQLVDRERTLPDSGRQADGDASEHARLNGERRPAWAGRRLLVLCVIFVSTVLAFNVANRAVQRMQARVAEKITGQLREDMHAKIVSLSMSYHLANTPGRLMSRILADVGVVQTHLMNLIVTASSQLVMFVVGVVIIFSLSPVIGWIVVASMVPYGVLAWRVRTKVREVNAEIRQTNSCLWGLVAQKIDAIRAIVAYSRERTEMLNFRRLSSCLLRDTIREQFLGAGMTRVADLISLVATRGILVYGAILVLGGSMTLGEMLYIHGAACSLFMPVLVLTQMTLQVSVLLVVLQRLAHIMDTRQEVAEDPRALNFPVPIHTGIELKHVTFTWISDRPPVLDDLNLHIPVGSWLCIMGPSGCGKTTLLQLIARLFDPQEGEINVDGISLEDIRFSSLRRHMALVPQEAQILSGTIRDNITYGCPEASPDAIMAAARAAEAHDFIMDLPVKYETLVGDRGTTLSGGQRQRISIARALITNPEILLLDDCTSALDANTEHRLQETLARLLQGKTAVIVSQRVSMAMRCHRVIVLENGRIREQGTPSRLLEAGGYFADLHAKQTS
ncbi:MAG: ABC transporter ATP-binding protein [Kiritimatiellae bacterium]|nr:ABC transporter ATP-binding protein [Kiritimatiellia bacterium]